jgi:hypothetical protein
MKLYEVPRETKVKVVENNSNLEVLFKHIDGMYSYCVDSNNNVIHLAAWTEVEIMEN